MTTGAAQLGFAAEFALFLVVCAAVVVVAGALDRGGSVRTRLAITTGLLALAVSAFVAGAELVEQPTDIAVLAPRLAGLIVVLAAAAGIPDRAAGAATAVGAVLVGVAQALHGAGAGNAAHLVQLVGAAGLAVATLRVSRRSIPARITSASAATILLVVLAVSVATSAVLTDNVADEALNRTEARAAAEAAQMETSAADAIISARIVASSLAGPRAPLLATVADQPESPEGQAAAAEIRDDLAELSNFLFARGPLLYLNSSGRAVALVGDIVRPELVELLGSDLVSEVLATAEPAQAVVVAGESMFAAGAHPVNIPTAEGARLVGAVIASDRLDEGYLEARRVDLPDEGLALVTRGGVLAGEGPRPARAVLASVGEEALNSGDPVGRETAGHFVVAHPVMRPDGGPVAAMVAALPTAAVDATRESLLRALFLAALVAVLVAVVLAALLGQRIGSGIRRLTTAAQEMEQGNLDTRAEVSSVDEVGVLAAAFNSMAESIGTMTGDLRQAAVDEARLRGRLEAVVDSMGEGLVAVDPRGVITDVNAAAEAVLGVTSGRAVGRPVTELVTLLDRDGVDITDRLVPGPPASWSVDGTIIGVTGTEVPALVSAGAVEGGEGEVLGATYVIRDVRREREVEQMKTDFLSNISHELRTPLTPIKGYAGLMAARDLPADRVRDLGQAMLQSSRQLERIIDQLVSFATIAAGRLSLRTEALDIRHELDDAIERWQDRLPSGVELRRRVSRDTGRIVADPRFLAQSLDELIDNAVKFSPSGGRIWLKAEPSSDGSRPMAEVAVVDKGVGVDADGIDELVGDFSQGDPSATRRFGGLGLGLAMVDRIVRAHEGELRMESLPGKGSTFAIVLPMEEKGGNRPRSRSRANARRPGGRRRPLQAKGRNGRKRSK